MSSDGRLARRRAARYLAGAALLALGAAWAAAGPGDRRPGVGARPPVPAPADAPPILLVSIDTLRADHLGIYGYPRPTSPRIDAFFSGARIYEAAYAAESYTAPSVVSMLTGLLPQQHGVRLLYQKLSPDVVTVADLLGGAGYQTAAVVSNIVLTAEAIGLDTRFDHYDDQVDEPEPYRDIFERRAARTTDAAIGWLESVRDPARPHFLWVHYIDPHGPYHPPDDAPVDFVHPTPLPIDVARIPDYEREPGIDDGLEYVDRYDEEIAYTDREVGRMLDAYARLGLAEAGLVILTSDHGESLMDHEQWFTHGHQVHEELVRVPLLVRGPGFDSGRVPAAVSLADVAPTLLRAAGQALPPGLTGRPLSEPDSQRAIFSEASGSGATPQQWRAMWHGTRKWVVKIERSRSRAARIVRALTGLEPWIGTEIVERQFYDLARDPGEERPGAWQQEDEAAPLLAQIERDPDPAGLPRRVSEQGRLLDAPKVDPATDAETLARLQALGYVHGTPAAPSSPAR